MSHLATIAGMPCVLCELLGLPQTSKTDAHHVRTGAGMAQRQHDDLAIPLCHDGCHQGPRGIHGDRSLLNVAKVDELDLLAMTIRKLNGTKPPREKAYKQGSKILPRRGMA
jgi:hypothetical protein